MSGSALPLSRSAGVAQAEIALGEEFVLRVGQTAALDGGTGLRLAFEAVLEDSRCPVEVTCVWAGDAVVAIAVDGTGGDTKTLELHTNSDFGTESITDGYRVRLIELSPLPREGSTIEVDRYQATLVVRRSVA